MAAAVVLAPRLTVEPWHPRGASDEEYAVAETRQSNAFVLSWAAGMLREALRRSPRLFARPYEIFGQGSRVNSTHLGHASDIDLVLMLKMPFESDVGARNERDIRDNFTKCNQGHYDWEAFRDDVLGALGESYIVRMGRRCANVDDLDSLFGEMVDILIATEYRLYPAFLGPGTELYQQGVFFRDREGRPIVNFPKQHRRNGEQKDLRTGGRFKEVVRTAKRVRRWAEHEGIIAEGDAPSYLIECLLYNVPDCVYRTSSLTKAYRGALHWLRRCHREDPASFARLPCQNGINLLFGAGPDQWDAGEAGRIVDVLHEI